MPFLRQLITLSLLAATANADFVTSVLPSAPGRQPRASISTRPRRHSHCRTAPVALVAAMTSRSGSAWAPRTVTWSSLSLITTTRTGLSLPTPSRRRALLPRRSSRAPSPPLSRVTRWLWFVSSIYLYNWALVSRLCSSQWVDQYVSSTGNYTQTVYLNGVVVSTLSTSDGEAEGWGSAVECASDNCGTVPAHSEFLEFVLLLLSNWPIFSDWTNVEIVLSAADPGYIDTMYLEVGAKASMSTSDGGKTWNVGTISIPQYTF